MENKLDKIYELVKENNKMLKAQKRKEFFAGIFKLVKWGLILFVAYWVWMNYIAPMIATLNSVTSQIQSTTSNLPDLQNIPLDPAALQNLPPELLQKLQNLLGN